MTLLILFIWCLSVVLISSIFGRPEPTSARWNVAKLGMRRFDEALSSQVQSPKILDMGDERQTVRLVESVMEDIALACATNGGDRRIA